MKKKTKVASRNEKPTYSSFVPAEHITHPANSRAGSGANSLHFSWPSVLLAGIAFGIISQTLHIADALLTMNFYTDPRYFSLWSPLMMPGPGAPPATFYILSVLTAVIAGFIFAYIYALVRPAIRQASALKTGIVYGSIIFLTGLPGMASLYLLIAIPPLLLGDWILWSFAISLIGGAAIAKIMG